VPLTAVDRTLLQRCLNHEPGAWNDFVDRYLGLIYHVVHHTAHLRSVPLSPEDTEDVAAEILLQLVANNYAVLRQFRGQASLATYLTVVGRRICVHELVKRGGGVEGHPRAATQRLANDYEDRPKAQVGLETLEEVQRLLNKLPTKERQVVRLFYFEGRNYEEISTALHIPVNSIGPILSRARQKLRKEEAKAAAAPLRQDQASRATQQPNA
jgi:RNA polymerase sigma-70 factor, ECF subfamily